VNTSRPGEAGLLRRFHPRVVTDAAGPAAQFRLLGWSEDFEGRDFALPDLFAFDIPGC
jgi:hypothetical protein